MGWTRAQYSNLIDILRFSSLANLIIKLIDLNDLRRYLMRCLGSSLEVNLKPTRSKILSVTLGISTILKMYEKIIGDWILANVKTLHLEILNDKLSESIFNLIFYLWRPFYSYR